ncbi:MAG: cobalt-precorrin-7 (C(5))-methyltransferase [Methanoregula sp.]|nr:cobalt-precorrin-7 (C(5))-methyltransferase [Methanoregula sp.]
MKVVGVGCGPGMLTEEAVRVIGSATLIFGSDRAIEIARAHIAFGTTVRTIDDFKGLDKLPQEAVVLSTGDPMLAGLGDLKGEVIPGISSLQVAAARLHIPLARIVPVVAHGTGHDQGMNDTVDEVRRRKIVFLLTDPKFNTVELFRKLLALGIPLNVAVCEDLGYPAERIEVGAVESPPQVTSGMYSLVIGDF